MTRIRDDARRLLRDAHDHEDQLEALIRAAETDGKDAQSALAHARARFTDPDWLAECAARFERSRALIIEAKRACAVAREQSIATRRLLGQFDQPGKTTVTTRSRKAGAAVLVVDDVEDVRDLAVLVLSNAGFVVRTADNGLEALIAAYDMQPEVIVMDLAMPVLDGIEATRLIKTAAQTRAAKVIAYTGNATIPDHRLFDAVLRKPSAPDALVAAVQTAAGRPGA